ncbi:MAG: glutathione binding-like protein [Phenylobacterium sp.]|uniref:glutathione binding-like protein n=1 Tax=Phenylobacterium sp. TaxID=1871053 RepID=UPI003918ABC6
MDLYYSPLACSLASRITVYEADAADRVSLHRVDTRAKRTADGADYLAINPKGQVPALRTDDGEVLTENAAILPYLADQFPGAGLAPASGLERYRLSQWLSFIGSELHKTVFTPLLSPTADEGAKAFARAAAPARLAYLDAHLTGREHLLDRFSVADAYLAAVLNWARFTAVDLGPYPAVAAYVDRLHKRPAVARAMQEEMGLFQAA